MMKHPGFNFSERRFLMVQRVGYTLLAIVLFVHALIAVREFLYPIAFGFLISYLLFPLVNWLEKKGVPRILANFIAIVGGLGVLFSLLLFAYSNVTPVVGDFPRLAQSGLRHLADSLSDLSEHFGFDRQETRQFLREQANRIFASGGEYLQDIFNATTSTLVSVGLLPVYVFLFLYYRTKFAYFLMMIVGREHRPELVTILREISQVFVRYIAGVLAVVFVLCILNSMGLWIIGMRYAIALGIISAVFNFIPYFGTLLGGAVPLLFALLIDNDPAMALRVVFLFVIIQFLENNILTPNIVGGNVRVNPFFIITGLVAASIIWGIPGMLLIVPFLAIVRIVLSHIDSMKPYAFLLGDTGTSRHAITVEKMKRFFGKRKKRS
ncbi:MAG: AI-2E family transporter [Marinilabiliaceae bacterium]